ncbi:MAG: SsrA-binding protein SmpB [Clostridia bacterium]|nr:SsrA-binding protein SmpB [Clostridia bacterium]
MVADAVKILVQNRKARHDYFIEETYEAGVELKGTEVKSIRLGRCNLKDSYAQVVSGQMLVYNMHISPYDNGNIFNTDPLRPKRLLMHKAEIRRLDQAVARQGLTLIPLELYLKRGRVKLLLALCKGKHNYDKRDDIAKRDADREMTRFVRRSGKRGME